MGHPDSDTLYQWLKQALRNLYDPKELKANPIFTALGFNPSDNSSLLRQKLIEEIEYLKPEEKISSQSQVWRTYHILTQRYVDQFSQNEVAINFGLSIRQLRRQERIALEILVQVLIPQIEKNPVAQDTQLINFEAAENKLLTPENEYKWLETSQPDEEINILDLYQNALNALAPIIKDHLIEIENDPLPNFSPTIMAQQASLQQGLVSMLSAGFALTHSSTIYTKINRDSAGISLSLKVDVMKPFSSEQENIVLNSLTSAADLVALSNAHITHPPTIIPGEPFIIRMFLPETFKKKVFVVDDNADVLQLFERFFSNSQYLFTGCNIPKDAVSNAAKIQPDLIFLDVMLPEIDGWELLGHFREHPDTKSIPIVICTILPQESLALMLGAAAFLQKPFTRMDLLSLSNRLTSD